MHDVIEFLQGSGFGQLHYSNLIMMGVGLLFIMLAIRKGYEPLLLVPIGFGILIGNIPYDSRQLSLSIYDGPTSELKLDYYVGEEPIVHEGRTIPAWTRLYVHLAEKDEADMKDGERELKKLIDEGNAVQLPLSTIKDLVAVERVIMVHTEEFLPYRGDASEPGIKDVRGGHKVFVKEEKENDRYPVVIEKQRQDTWMASVFWFIFRGIEWGFYPPLIFLGVGALTDFGPLLANPRTILLGAAAQFGIFGALLLALLFDFSLQEAGAIGIIGGADGPTAIFTCSQLAPHLLGAVALAAYSYMAMVPIIQPPIMRLLTTRKERLIRMPPPKDVSRSTRIMFPICGFVLTALLANGALPLLGMLFFGNLLRESMVTERLAKTAQTAFIDIITILLGLSVGLKTQASTFLTFQTIGIFVLGIVAFALATIAGVLFGKLMNKLSSDPINPLIGAAGVSAVPMAARVVQKVAHEEDRQNFLLMHAMGPNVAGVIGSAVAAGVILSHLM